MEKTVEVAVGTYEELILGYRLSLDQDSYEFIPTFTNHSHTGCIKTLAMSEKGMLASGGTDETIWLFNLRKKQELGSLVHHSGTVTCLSFFERSHLFSTSEDAKLCVWKSHSWECLRSFKGHTGPITSVAVHPSGKLALTTGLDRSLHTWNLVRGRPAYVTNIKEAADIVQWSPDGSMYLIVFNNRIDFYKVETAAVFHSVNTPKKINAALFLQDTLIVYGGACGDIVIYNLNTKTEVQRICTDTIRIRGLAAVKTTQEDCPLLLLSASSDGMIHAYKVVFSKDSVQASLVASHNTKFRLTCIAAKEIMVVKKEIKDELIDFEEMDMKVEENSDSETQVKSEPESDSAPETSKTSKHAKLELSEDDVKVEPESDDSSEEMPTKAQSKVPDVDSGHVEDSESDSDESAKRSRKRSRSSLKVKAKAKKVKLKAEHVEMKMKKTKKLKKQSGKGEHKIKKAKQKRKHVKLTVKNG